MELIILIIILVIWAISKAHLEYKVDNYDVTKISTGKMAMDSDKSPSEIKRNLVAGKYDKDENWKT